MSGIRVGDLIRYEDVVWEVIDYQREDDAVLVIPKGTRMETLSFRDAEDHRIARNTAGGPW